jgi:DNA-binding SARP family transcriptional activator/tetratricopeptide (TPR) repeat protein
MIPFRLTVLGSPELHAPNGDPIRFRTRKHLALLVFLTVEPPIPHRRDRLATLLWGGASVAEGRHSLATALSLLRGRLGSAALDTNRHTVRLVPGRITTDLAGLQYDDVTDSTVAPRGAFLDDFEIDDSSDFAIWKAGQRARLLPQLHAAISRRIDHYRKRGDTARMEEFAYRLLRIDELSEEGTRACLETRTLAGDRIGALRLFERWRVQLAEELGATPSISTERMADRLRRGSPERIVTAAVGTDAWKERTLVGRGQEFASCYAVWETVRKGQPRHLLLHGESGIGKTTLVDRLATSIALEGAAIARVKCYELERELPFGVIGGMVSLLLELPGASTTAPEHLAELGRLVPRVRQRYPSLPMPLYSAGESARLLFTEGVMALVAAVAEEHPVVLAFDDIHLADETSLAVLHLMLRRIRALPLMVVLTSCTTRQNEIGGAQDLASGSESISLTLLHLGPLAREEANALLDALTDNPSELGPVPRRAILSGAQGNPLALELLLADWRRRGDDCLALALGAMTRGTCQPRAETFRSLVGRTLSALEPEARSVMELGAILGNRLNDLTMYSLVDLHAGQTLRAMTYLSGQRILRDAGPMLEFANDLIRAQCYVGMAEPLRRMLHGAVADRLLMQDGSPDPIPGLEIAWHLVRADRLVEAVPYLLAGGREAIRRTAAHEAEIALSTGLQELTGRPRRTAILLLAEAQQELGRWDDSLQLLELADEPFDSSERACREVYQTIARRWLGHISAKNMIEATNGLFAIAANDTDIDARVKALAASVRLLTLTRDESQLVRLEQLTALVGGTEMEPFQRLHLILARAWILSATRKTGEGLGEIERGIQLADEAHITSSIVARLLVGYGCCLCMKGRYSDALAPLNRAALIAERLDNRTLRGECASQLALAEGRSGNIGAQIRWAQEALRLFSPTEWSASVVGATYELALGLIDEERYTEAREIATRLEDRLTPDAPGWIAQGALLCCADVIALSGQPRRAYALARKGTSGRVATLQHAAYAGQFARWVMRLGVRDKCVHEARARLTACFPRPNELDSKDQTEVLAAFTILDAKLGLDPADAWKEIARRLQLLPPSISTLMRRLGAHAEAVDCEWGFQ